MIRTSNPFTPLRSHEPALLLPLLALLPLVPLAVRGPDGEGGPGLVLGGGAAGGAQGERERVGTRAVEGRCGKCTNYCIQYMYDSVRCYEYMCTRKICTEPSSIDGNRQPFSLLYYCLLINLTKTDLLNCL